MTPDLLLSAALTAVLLVASVATFILSKPRSFAGRLYRVVPTRHPGQPLLLFSTLHGLLRRRWYRWWFSQPPVSFEISGSAGQASFGIFIPDAIAGTVERLLRACYPGAELVEVLEQSNAPVAMRMSLRLRRGDLFPIQVLRGVEPLTPVLAVLAEPRQGEEIRLQIVTMPIPSGWSIRARVVAARLRSGFGRGLLSSIWGSPSRTPNSLELRDAAAIEEKSDGLPFSCEIRIITCAASEARANELMRDMVAVLRPFAGVNSFVHRRPLFGMLFDADFKRRSLPIVGGIVLTDHELAGLWHMPEEFPIYLLANRSISIPPPFAAGGAGRILGLATSPRDPRPITQSIVDARTHLALFGPPGVGKSETIRNLVRQDIAAGRGIALFDPKGDTGSAVLSDIPGDRIDDVIYVTPRERGRVVGLNPLETHGLDPARVADNLVAALHRIYQGWWGPRTEEVARAVFLALVGLPGMTLAHVPLILTDDAFRRSVLQKRPDEIGAGSFWRWYERLGESQRLDVVGPLSNRLRAFLSLPAVRRILCQPTSTLNLREVLGQRRILILDLTSSEWGETTARLVGSMIFGSLWGATRSRLAIPEDRRPDFGVFVDEMSHFVNIAGNFADVLAQARGLHLPLTLATQHLGQLDPELREAVLSNARSKIVFQCGVQDARVFAREFAPLDAGDLLNLPRYHAAVRLVVDGQLSSAFTMRTLPAPAPADPDMLERVRARSAERWGRPVEEVDRELRASLKTDTPPTGELGVGRTRRRG